MWPRPQALADGRMAIVMCGIYTTSSHNYDTVRFYRLPQNVSFSDGDLLESSQTRPQSHPVGNTHMQIRLSECPGENGPENGLVELS